jgi:hypothetical protein
MTILSGAGLWTRFPRRLNGQFGYLWRVVERPGGFLRTVGLFTYLAAMKAPVAAKPRAGKEALALRVARFGADESAAKTSCHVAAGAARIALPRSDDRLALAARDGGLSAAWPTFVGRGPYPARNSAAAPRSTASARSRSSVLTCKCSSAAMAARPASRFRQASGAAGSQAGNGAPPRCGDGARRGRIDLTAEDRPWRRCPASRFLGA